MSRRKRPHRRDIGSMTWIMTWSSASKDLHSTDSVPPSESFSMHLRIRPSSHNWVRPGPSMGRPWRAVPRLNGIWRRKPRRNPAKSGAGSRRNWRLGFRSGRSRPLSREGRSRCETCFQVRPARLSKAAHPAPTPPSCGKAFCASYAPWLIVSSIDLIDVRISLNSGGSSKNNWSMAR